MKPLHLICAAALLLSPLVPTAYGQAPRTERGNLVMEGLPAEMPARITDKLAQYNNVRSASVADWAPDGRSLLISTRFGDVAQLHRVSAPGAYREQLTFYPEPVGGAAANPNPGSQHIVFSKDVGGAENYQFFLMDLNTKQVQQFTDGKSRNISFDWSRKGDQLAYLSNKRTGQDMDLYLAPASNPDRAAMLLQLQGGGWGIADWRADGAQMMLQNYISANQSELYTLDMSSKKLERILQSDKQISYGGAQYSADGKGAYILSDEDTDFTTLRFYDFGTRKINQITQDIKWDVTTFSMNRQGTQAAFTTNEDGYYKLYLLNPATNKYEQVQNLPKGVYGSMRFHPDGQRLALTITTAALPADAYVLHTGTRQLERWTYSELAGLDPTRFVEPELVRFATFDKANKKDKQNRQIPAFVYRPKNSSGKAPVIINIHGGPEGQSLPTFSATVQYMVQEMGMAVVVPNVRGSSGYGKEYLKLDNGFLRENSVKDIGALLDWIAKQPDLDASRVAVMGGSYGGYMTLASMTHYNNRLKGGIDIVGISNFVTFLKNTAGYRRDLRRVEYGDERDPKMEAHLQKISPNNNVQKITKPMFIIQGLNDPRVPVTEAEQIVEALKKNGNPTWYLMAKDEGHGFAKKQNRDFMNAAVMLFLEQHVVGNAPAPGPTGSR